MSEKYDDLNKAKTACRKVLNKSGNTAWGKFRATLAARRSLVGPYMYWIDICFFILLLIAIQDTSAWVGIVGLIIFSLLESMFFYYAWKIVGLVIMSPQIPESQ